MTESRNCFFASAELIAANRAINYIIVATCVLTIGLDTILNNCFRRRVPECICRFGFLVMAHGAFVLVCSIFGARWRDDRIPIAKAVTVRRDYRNVSLIVAS